MTLGVSFLPRFVKSGVCWNTGQAERALRKHRYDTIAEGIGLDRVTANVALAAVDDAVAVADQEAVDMAHFLLRHEGLFVGSSSAVNVAATVRYCQARNGIAAAAAKEVARDRGGEGASPAKDEEAVGASSSSSPLGPLPKDAVVVTVLCDSGHRHTSRFWCREKLASDFNLRWPTESVPPWCRIEGDDRGL